MDCRATTKHMQIRYTLDATDIDVHQFLKILILVDFLNVMLYVVKMELMTKMVSHFSENVLSSHSQTAHVRPPD